MVGATERVLKGDDGHGEGRWKDRCWQLLYCLWGEEVLVRSWGRVQPCVDRKCETTNVSACHPLHISSQLAALPFPHAFLSTCLHHVHHPLSTPAPLPLPSHLAPVPDFPPAPSPHLSQHVLHPHFHQHLPPFPSFPPHMSFPTPLSHIFWQRSLSPFPSLPAALPHLPTCRSMSNTGRSSAVAAAPSWSGARHLLAVVHTALMI